MYSFSVLVLKIATDDHYIAFGPIKVEVKLV